MPLQAPNLDDRTYADLVAEAKTLIPRYNPEWTNFNENDPGITLLELFAWMTEILIYRLNQVPENNYIKFLQLLGIKPQPAEPARADLTFKLARNDIDSVIVPLGAQIAASGGSGGTPLVFETDTALVALGAELKAVQSFDAFSYSVQTAKNSQPGQWYYPFGPNAREGSALLLGFDSPIDFTQQQVNLMVYVYTENLKAEGQHCAMDVMTLPVQATLVWEYWNVQQQLWLPLVLDRDETRAFTNNGHIYFRGPGSSLKKDKIGQVPDPLYWIRVRLAQSSYETAPRLAMVLTNTVGARQAITVRNESLGASNGTPNQVFQVSQTPIMVRDTPLTLTRADGLRVTVTSLQLEVDESGNGNFQPWQEVDDFYASGPDDPHYVLDRTTGEVAFGNGKHGRIPVATTSTATIVAREYSYGGGSQGNVGANTITQLETFVQSIDSVTNLQPAFGGSDEETLDDTKLRAPLELKSQGRAVTAEDFELIAIETPSARIRKAKALPLTHPKLGQPIPGVVTVIVVPDSDLPNPTPSPATLAIVCAHLNKHRLLTSEVYVVPPTYRRVRVDANIIALPEADLSEVTRGVQDRLTNYFHPLTGGDDGQGWPFGQDIYSSRVYRVVLETPGVDRIQNNQLDIFLDNERQQFCRDVPIGTGNLLYSEIHRIQVSYF